MQLRVPAAGLAIGLACAALAATAFGQPTSNISAKEKMATCQFGAKDQNLKGQAEKDFIKKCMANEPAPKKSSETKK
ncbi:MAG: PsiF family protein [Xanthobacteraceae bacterium]